MKKEVFFYLSLLFISFVITTDLYCTIEYEESIMLLEENPIMYSLMEKFGISAAISVRVWLGMLAMMLMAGLHGTRGEKIAWILNLAYLIQCLWLLHKFLS